MMENKLMTGDQWSIIEQQSYTLVKSGFLPTNIKTKEQAIAITLKGRELGIPPMHAFSHINIINGKPAVSPELQLALIFKNVPGAKINYLQNDNKACKIEAFRPGHKIQIFGFTMDDAETAGLVNKQNWKTYPRAMLRSRAISEMARSLFPDAIMGCSYNPEELGARVNEDFEVVEVEEENRSEELSKIDMLEQFEDLLSQIKDDKKRDMMIEFILKNEGNNEILEKTRKRIIDYIEGEQNNEKTSEPK